jgi:outer membrane protein assembly factor BamA
MILLFNAEIAVVDVWNQPENSFFATTKKLRNPDGTPVLDGMGNPILIPFQEPISNVPIYDRLYLGGSNNLRGFQFRDVGPRDNQGQPIGGNSMARFTTELTFPIIEKARGAIFYDTGFVNAGAYDFNTNHVASDIGIGLRLDLPIGPLRVDYGFPIQTDGQGQHGHFNFNVGYQF